MASLLVQGSVVGNALQQLLLADDIAVGSSPSYQLCKTIYEYHPLGAKMAEKPVRIAQSQGRDIAIPDSPEARVKEQFEKTWEKLGLTQTIFATRVQSRVYGIASLALVEEGVEPNMPVDWKGLGKRKIKLNVFDPLNTAGSLVLNQDPLSIYFQHAQEIRVNGKVFHQSRSRTVMNEFPIYISYTPSAFGFVGRSCYQRSLFPLKSYIQTMITNDMVSLKAGVIVAKIQQAGSIITGAIQTMFGLKREVVKDAVVGNVISIGTQGEEVESLNLTNTAEAIKATRQNILEDIASGAAMPAKMLTEETFAAGFGEGTEDSKEQARYVDGERREMEPLYQFCDDICMRVAWDEEFYAVIQKDFAKEYGKLDYETAFYKWKNSFHAEWPSLLTEPESEQVKVADVKLRALVAVLQVYMPQLKGDELAAAMQWVADNINEMKLLFGSPLYLDWQAVADRNEADIQEQKDLAAKTAENAFGGSGKDGDGDGDGTTGEGKKPTPFGRADSILTAQDAIDALQDAVGRLPEKKRLARAA